MGYGVAAEPRARKPFRAVAALSISFHLLSHEVQPRYSQPAHETVFGDADAAVDLDTDALASLLNGTCALKEV